MKGKALAHKNDNATYLEEFNTATENVAALVAAAAVENTVAAKQLIVNGLE